jgi:hypothetical protein
MQKTDVRNKAQRRAFYNDSIGFAFGQNFNVEKPAAM